MAVMGDDLVDVIADCLPRDHAGQSGPEAAFTAFAAEHAAQVGGTLAVLDLGCGDGRAIRFFAGHGDHVDYHGVDIEASPEVMSRTIADARLKSYNGVDLPYDDASFDCVWSNQVFEHVVQPRAVLAEVRRVLKPGGRFVGSVSFLEPYHSYSTFSYSPYGLALLFKEAGLDAITLRPGIDGVTLALRSALPHRGLLDRYFNRESPLNALFERRARRQGWSVAKTASVKLRFAGHIVFSARRPPGA